MTKRRKKDRKGFRNVREMRKVYDKGVKIYSPRGELLYTGKPGFSIDYGELLKQKRHKYRRYEA
ncbi:hypothetical protein ES695_05540 [Candidatus Atribacteria bacterium 1244-E10-H5-B2]|nr:MAG: hypothetical protein ES695_05540 [Candidatus Atribacteria bacterium 1244-E10-H5-B2]